MNVLDDFLWRAALAGIGVAVIAAPLGCFVVWRRMAYFGDATAHAAILGVALSLALDVSILFGALAMALFMAVSVSALRDRGYPMDTVLGVLAHSALAFGLVAVSFVSGIRVDVSAYLFGDILTVSVTDLALIACGVASVLGLLVWRWNRLLIATVNEEMAQAAGVNPKSEQWVLTFALAVVVAVAIKVVGALLIGALLLIPAATARRFAGTPEAMAVLAAVFGVVSALTGLYVSWYLDTPTGPSMVCVCAVLFWGSTLIRKTGSVV